MLLLYKLRNESKELSIWLRIKIQRILLILETTKGRVVIELLADLAPCHVGRIKELVREGAYDNVIFHRVIDGFMAQTGDVQFGKRIVKNSIYHVQVWVVQKNQI